MMAGSTVEKNPQCFPWHSRSIDLGVVPKWVDISRSSKTILESDVRHTVGGGER